MSYIQGSEAKMAVESSSTRKETGNVTPLERILQK